jgi:hypothetical protein
MHIEETPLFLRSSYTCLQPHPRLSSSSTHPVARLHADPSKSAHNDDIGTTTYNVHDVYAGRYSAVSALSPSHKRLYPSAIHLPRPTISLTKRNSISSVRKACPNTVADRLRVQTTPKIFNPSTPIFVISSVLVQDYSALTEHGRHENTKSYPKIPARPDNPRILFISLLFPSPFIEFQLITQNLLICINV